MPVRISLNTEQTRFDLAAMIQEWVDFLETQCGYEKADFALVALLVHEHSLNFRQIIHDEGFHWDDLSGDFLVGDFVWQVMQDTSGGFPYSREALDQVWSDCFEAVNEAFDSVEERLHQERELGLL
jgi:hypothetical protein